MWFELRINGFPRLNIFLQEALDMVEHKWEEYMTSKYLQYCYRKYAKSRAKGPALVSLNIYY